MESATPDRTFCGPNISYVLASQSYLRDFTQQISLFIKIHPTMSFQKFTVPIRCKSFWKRIHFLSVFFFVFFQKIFHLPDYYSCSPFSLASCLFATLSVSDCFLLLLLTDACCWGRYKVVTRQDHTDYKWNSNETQNNNESTGGFVPKAYADRRR
jgi:hypothetical protein